MATHRFNDRMKLNFSDNFTYYDGEVNNYLSAYFNLFLGTRFEVSSGLNLYNFEQVLPVLHAATPQKEYNFTWQQIIFTGCATI